ncbi:hypothetical protein AB8A31_00615 [Tardiphaga sp. 804_B3_N1_9]|uniref:hypothetical protein n=1 Tax=Tardiphaga TaxID=1395974 RepID=UPI0015869F6D|nr:hypothetical protein [Tardiphaga robiniae]NUU44630.1 hypothetical protein [Tardiphaga robiniae]
MTIEPASFADGTSDRLKVPHVDPGKVTSLDLSTAAANLAWTVMTYPLSFADRTIDDLMIAEIDLSGMSSL